MKITTKINIKVKNKTTKNEEYKLNYCKKSQSHLEKCFSALKKKHIYNVKNKI